MGRTGDVIWQISPKAEPNNENYSKLEMADFSAEARSGGRPPSGRRPIKVHLKRLSNSSAVLEMNSSVCENMGPLGSAPFRVI